MKIQCDVCTAEPAAVFCCADEAALCSACDRRVHTANKLAGKHRRLSLSSSFQPPPLCDICQEKQGFIFCQEDRAILCKDCDEPIHCANELTKKHNRFLLSGALRLSSTSMPEPPTTSTSASTDTSTITHANINSNNNNSSSSSSISEYLIKTLPGWCVEDLLEETMDDCFLMEGSVEEEIAIWQAPQVPQAPQSDQISSHVFNLQEMERVSFGNFEFTAKSGRPEKRSSDDAFRVPQISTTNVESYKRSRTLNANSSSSMPSYSFWYC